MEEPAARQLADAGAPSFAAVAALPRVSASERAAMLAGPRDRERHRELAAGLPALHAVEVGGAARAAAAPPAQLRVAAWNAERGVSLAGAAALLRASGADVALLSELDLGMARSGQRHVARELAADLGMAYAFGVEFLELDLGDASERARCAGAENEVGYHGGAILAAVPFARPALVRLDAGGDWFDGRRGEARVGGRVALLATVNLAGVGVALASVHLESHAGPELRDAQTAALLRALDAYAPGAPAVLGGDWNTHGLPLAALEDRAALRAALAAAPTRVVRPVPHEPLFARLEEAGFERHACNLDETPTERRRSEGGSRRGVLHLDWLFVRGLRAEESAVLDAVDSCGVALSDHEVVTATVTPSGGANGPSGPPARRARP
ncbi:MAG TPA: endonuclease/exonuclease/phosphatase family protein [Myxococcota bacterium]|nr:endonuclease/exonuclease/phosphatase family protein [Myxococcota bacterium]